MSLLLRKSLSQAKLCLPGGRKRIPKTSVSSTFHFPFLNAESSLVCGIPFFFLFLKKEGQKERSTSAFFLFFCDERKKENAPRMKDGIRRKEGRRRSASREGEKRKAAACHKTPRFRLYGIFGEKGRIYPHQYHLSSCGSISDETGVYAKQKKAVRCRMQMTAPLRCTPGQEKGTHTGERHYFS